MFKKEYIAPELVEIKHDVLELLAGTTYEKGDDEEEHFDAKEWSSELFNYDDVNVD